MSIQVDIINIGTLSRNVLWNEDGPVRPAHATTTLIRSNGTAILIDPSLPPELMRHRLDERTGLRPDQIDVVFLTNFSPVHRRGLAIFDKAEWFLGEVEREAMLSQLNHLLASGGFEDGVTYEAVEADITLLGRIKAASERLAEGVDLFPSFGATPGSTSLLINAARTIVVAGDAVVTRDYFDQRRVWDRSTDPEKAKESFVEIVEIADAVIPGHDNLIYLA